MPPKQIIALATHHHVQLKGHSLNLRFGQVIFLIREHYPIEIILEEWRPDRQSFASTVDTDKLKWKNVGTPQEKQFETYAWGLNTDPPTYDPKKPMLQEYGPLDVHELRERYMVGRVIEAMEPFNVGLFIVGLAHLHSTLSKLKANGFDVRGYSWMEQ
jgi:predicted MPP superfamily phosphohydrolase